MDESSIETPAQASRQRLREVLERVPFARLLGIEIAEAAPGAVSLCLEARDELMRLEGIMHGGAIASLADTAAAFAAISTLAPDEKTVTVDMTLHFLRPLREGRATAHARVLRAGRRLLTISVEVTDESGKLAATMLTTYARIQRDQ